MEELRHQGRLHILRHGVEAAAPCSIQGVLVYAAPTVFKPAIRQPCPMQPTSCRTSCSAAPIPCAVLILIVLVHAAPHAHGFRQTSSAPSLRQTVSHGRQNIRTRSRRSRPSSSAPWKLHVFLFIFVSSIEHNSLILLSKPCSPCSCQSMKNNHIMERLFILKTHLISME